MVKSFAGFVLVRTQDVPEHDDDENDEEDEALGANFWDESEDDLEDEE